MVSKLLSKIFARRSPKNVATRPVPGSLREPERYEGRPLYVLLENYVLAAIGELDPKKDDGLAAVTQKVFGGTHDWRATLRDRLRLSDSIDEELLRMWERNQEIARADRTELQPVQFAKMIVDTNFAPLIDDKS